MKFRCERDDLLESVLFATRAISNRATLAGVVGASCRGDRGWCAFGSRPPTSS